MIAKEEALNIFRRFLNLGMDIKTASKCTVMYCDAKLECYANPPVGGIDWAIRRTEHWEEIKEEAKKLSIFKEEKAL